MANRRMFSRDVVETDKFLGMPLTTQALYFHLGMEADDDGFVSSPKKIQRAVGCTEGDLKHLAACGYIIPFESGVVVISHWKQSNYVQSDRYKKTLYQEEAEKLSLEKGVYSLDTGCIRIASNTDTQDRLSKDSIGKVNIGYINTFAQTNGNESTQTPENGTGIFMVLEDGSFYDVLPEKLEQWKKAYPELDVERELYRMASWCDANPTRRKTRRGIEKFINGWLNRSQNDNMQYSKREEGKNDAAEPEEDKFHVSSGNEIYERLKREGLL